MRNWQRISQTCALGSVSDFGSDLYRLPLECLRLGTSFSRSPRVSAWFLFMLH